MISGRQFHLIKISIVPEFILTWFQTVDDTHRISEFPDIFFQFFIWSLVSAGAVNITLEIAGPTGAGGPNTILPAEKPIKNAFGVLKRTIDLWKGEVVINDVLLALSRPEGKCGPDSIVINLHYLPKRFFIKHFNDLVFNPEDMLEMWDAGYRREEDPAGGKFIYQHSEIKICKEKLREYFTELTKYIEEKKKWLQSVK